MKITENTSQALRQWCRDNLPPIQPVAHYNPTFAELIQHREQGKVLVFNGGAATENTVFLKPDDRFYYRAWHDTIHIRQHLPLDHVSELKVARLQYTYALAAGIHPRDAELLVDDLYCHIRYHQTHGAHPEYQTALIADYRRNGNAAFAHCYH